MMDENQDIPAGATPVMILERELGGDPLYVVDFGEWNELDATYFRLGDRR
jgi:hypothetical protein